MFDYAAFFLLTVARCACNAAILDEIDGDFGVIGDFKLNFGFGF